MADKKILILCPSPKGTAATQRLKYEQYLTLLEEAGYTFTISSFQTDRFWKIIYERGRIGEKALWTAVGYARRLRDLLRAPFYDAVFVNLWVTPLGPPWFEKALLSLNKKVIYDLDDMLFLAPDGQAGQTLIQRLKGKQKPVVLMEHAAHVIVCTPKLEEIARAKNRFHHATDISSTFDTDRFVPVPGYQKKSPTVIGWTGTHSTLPFLQTLEPVLAKVAKQRDIELLVIANREYTMPGVKTRFVRWSDATEVADLHQMDIGLYPIPQNEWSLGKSSLKALTYMSIAIPFVATAYGTNYRIMTQGVEGFLADTPEQWEEYLLRLIDDVDLRRTMGLAGRKRVERDFSVRANYPKYLEVFHDVTRA